jgi:hypothetical protein
MDKGGQEDDGQWRTRKWTRGERRRTTYINVRTSTCVIVLGQIVIEADFVTNMLANGNRVRVDQPVVPRLDTVAWSRKLRHGGIVNAPIEFEGQCQCQLTDRASIKLPTLYQ